MGYRDYGVEYRPDGYDATICKKDEITVYSDDILEIITIQGAEGFIHMTRREAVAVLNAISGLDWINK